MKRKKYLLFFITVIILAAIDQLIKLVVITKLPYKSELPVLGDVITLNHIHNSGAAWGSFSGKITFLFIFSIIAIVLILYIYHNIVEIDRFKPLRICLAFITGGAIGNMIDRVRLGYVIDYIYFKIIDFPVFNFADICVTLSMFIVLILLIFKYRQSDYDVIIGDNREK